LNRASIAYREARESHYWLRLLRDGKYLEPKLANSLLGDCDELVRILSSITKTTRERIQNADADNNS
jgi:four helix bundle protein